jgi:hypothetical protein
MRFLYKASRQVTTVAGTGENVNDFQHGILDRARLNPVYISVDRNQNIFVTVGDAGGSGDFLVLINEEENSIKTILTQEQGFAHRTPPTIHPETQQVLLGHEHVRDRFLILDPVNNWAPTLHFIREWDVSGGEEDGYWDGMGRPVFEEDVPARSKRSKFSVPGTPGQEHYQLLWCSYDRHFYTRYGSGMNNGQIVKICPETWNATVIGMTPAGRTYSIAFNTDPNRLWELWMAYSGDDGGPAEVVHTLATVDIRDTKTWYEANGAGTHPLGGTGDVFYGIMSSFE